MSVKQGPRCRVVGCSNQKKPVTPGTSLFLVPSHAETFEKWLQLTGNPELLDLPINFLRNNLRICEKHFLPDQVWVGTKHKLLKRGDSGPPVPSQFHEDHIPISDKEMLKWRLTEHYNKAVYNPMISKKRKTESKDVIIRILQEDFITNEDGDQCMASEVSSNESADTAVHAAISPDEKTESNNVIIHIIQEDDLINEGGGQCTALEFSSNESTADIAVHAAISPNEKTESKNVIIRVLQEDFITDEEDQSRASEFSSNETSADVAVHVPFSLNDKTEEVNYTVLEDYITNGEESESRTQEPSPSEPSVDGAVHAATLIEEPEPVKPTGQKDCNTSEEGSQSKTSESSSSASSSEWEPYYMLMPVGDQLMAIPCLSIQIPGMK